ncbi:hypothetical protein GYMLUDRAFT_237589 [Collybiopsis luxurians FD-317 M1]|nr:hypothetical protein GYMLUDRAFT_237589 [Collybiopsis luxurians FD-317 M1]
MVKEIILARSPDGVPVYELGRLDSTFEMRVLELPELKEDQLLLKTIFLTQRVWIEKDQNPERGYIAPVLPGHRMRASAIAKVLKSTAPSISQDDLVQCYIGWAEQAVLDAKDVFPLPSDLGLSSPTVYLGTLGLTGLTAYFGVKDVCRLEEGQSIIVSGAAGATGNVVVQLAKHVFKASKVIAIAGSDEKCEWLKTIGADVALNYKSSSFASDLAAAAKPSYVDCYFDNVGGAILNACLPLIKKHGRVAACGSISNYNDKSQMVLDNWAEIILNRIIVEGFVVLDFYHRRPEAMQVISTAIKESKLSISGTDTVVRSSFEKVPETWARLYRGENLGKLVTQVADL